MILLKPAAARYMNSRQYREMQRELLLSWVAVFCLLLAGVGVFFGAKLYDRWTVHRQMVSAKTSRQSGDFAAEIGTLAKVAQAKPDHLIAIRMLAEALEQVRSPEAISFREKAIGVAPDSIEDLFHLLNASLSFENISKAEMALGLLRKNPQLPSAALHPYLARLALLKGDPKTADAEYAECLRLEPKNTGYILAAASLASGGWKRRKPRSSTSGARALSSRSAVSHCGVAWAGSGRHPRRHREAGRVYRLLVGRRFGDE